MARTSAQDPLDRFRFLVDITGFTRSGFVTCSSPAYSIEKKEYKEGGRHLNPLIIVEGVSYRPVVLTTGVTTDTSFNIWANGFIDIVQNNAGLTNNTTTSDSVANLLNGGTKSVPSNTGDYTSYSYRRTVTISQLDRTGTIQLAYILYNAFPIEYEPASGFDSNSSEVSIQSLTLGYESFDVQYAGITGVISSLIAQAL